MALVDSEAAFEQRMREVVVNAAARMAVVNSGIRTFSALAFAVGTPQTPPNDDAFRGFSAFLTGSFLQDMTWQLTVPLGDYTLKLRLWW